MRFKITLLSLIVLLLAAAAGAQTKISGTFQCSKPDVEHTVQIGDRPNHSFTISQAKCTWTKPVTIEGIQNKEGITTGFAETTGNTSRNRGYYVGTMANGDKTHYRWELIVSLKEGVPQSFEETWTLLGGTGKFKGIRGKGTCKGKFNPDGSLTADAEGEYQLPIKTPARHSSANAAGQALRRTPQDKPALDSF